ncbi:MAG: alpha/beta hydrolase [Bdellovibrio sp.]|nr:alpha/beta hydrolase [Bdellovibrio sp.]
MDSSLFLHYGPGGSSDIEAAVLGSQWPNVLFWNQPKFKDRLNPYQELVNACAQQAQEMQAKQMIGHSFGCDLLSSILKTKLPQLPHLVVENSILISPLRSIPTAFINLGRVLQRKQDVPALAEAIQSVAPFLSAPPPDLFWNLIIQISTHPFYLQSFWANQKAKENSDKLAALSTPFDAAEWQTLVNDYLFAYKNSDTNHLKNKKIKAIFGDSDPYLDENDFTFWKNLLGLEQVIIIKNSGHYPHLENQEAFLRSVKVLK